MTSYELRTSSGARILAFDDIARAKAEQAKRQCHFQRPLELWRVSTVAEKVA